MPATKTAINENNLKSGSSCKKSFLQGHNEKLLAKEISKRTNANKTYIIIVHKLNNIMSFVKLLCYVFWLQKASPSSSSTSSGLAVSNINIITDTLINIIATTKNRQGSNMKCVCHINMMPFSFSQCKLRAFKEKKPNATCNNSLNPLYWVSSLQKQYFFMFICCK